MINSNFFCLATFILAAITTSVLASDRASSTDKVESPHKSTNSLLQITVCGVDIASPPFFSFTYSDTPENGEHNGVAYEIMNEVTTQLGINILIKRYPWKRCLAYLKDGSIDGVMGASYLKERSDFGHYPLKDTGEIDYSRIIYSNDYWLYTNDENVFWDGKTLVLPDAGIVGTGLGYSSAKLLSNLGAKVFEAHSPSTLASMLMSQEIAAIAGYAKQIEPHFVNYRRRAGINSESIRKFHIPLAQDNMFLLVSKQFYRKHKKVAERVWNVFGDIHKDGRYQGIFNSYIVE